MIYHIETDQTKWDTFVQSHSGHPLQLWGWGELKTAHGWSAARIFVITEDGETIGAAQILTRPLPYPFNRLCYIPRGPIIIGKNTTRVLSSLADYAKKQGAVLLKIEPEWPKDTHLPSKKWRHSKNHILLGHTATLDLTKTPEELQSIMASKTRQYIRKSEKSVTVRRATSAKDIQKCLDIYDATAARAHFTLHDRAYYRDLHRLLGAASQIYVAESEGEIVSFLWLATSLSTAFELYGGVNDLGQQTRANYILKWTAILDMQKSGVTTYDMNGLLNDGVSGFKLSFTGGAETDFVGSLDLPLSPLYQLWESLLPSAKKVIRKTKKMMGKS